MIKKILAVLAFLAAVLVFSCENPPKARDTHLGSATMNVQDAGAVLQESTTVINTEAKDIRKITTQPEVATKADTIVDETATLMVVREKLKEIENKLQSETLLKEETANLAKKEKEELLAEIENLKKDKDEVVSKLLKENADLKDTSQKALMTGLGLLIFGSVVSFGVSVALGNMKWGIASISTAGASISIIKNSTQFGYIGLALSAAVGAILLWQFISTIRDKKVLKTGLEEVVETVQKVKNKDKSVAESIRKIGDETQSFKTKALVAQTKEKLGK